MLACSHEYGDKLGSLGSIKEGTVNKDCQSWAADLSAYSDDELDVQAAGALEAHLSGCADCTRELMRTRKLQSLLNAVAPNTSGNRRIGQRLWARFSEAMSEWVSGTTSTAKGRRPTGD
jgi:anti-sigma factor RsiW